MAKTPIPDVVLEAEQGLEAITAVSALAGETSSYGHFLIYGDSGSGKSTSAATWPKPMLVFMWDPHGKDIPYLKRGQPGPRLVDAYGTPYQEVLSTKSGETIIRIEHYIDLDPLKPQAYARFLRRLSDGGEFPEWRTVVLDSVTFMELMARKYAQYTLMPNSKEPRQWFASSTDTLEEVLMVRFGALPQNVVVLAHIDEDKDELNGVYLRNPMAPGRLRKRSPAGYSEVYRAYVRRDTNGEREYLWQTRSDNMYSATTQLDAPDPCVQHYTAIFGG